ncbi:MULTISPECIES: CreA family protein [unclassified Haematospirillum]|uniref:CreA family protein n=1 Tax=unclassified Haematospirillum TaxID=2622088 RepID=UPI00143A0AA4|nr:MULTISPECIES: CreA family protein [unclassified Haematospirillum]NKD54555.1 CreA family protein [Haematospirillum sp. H4890]NKD74833.1 CreA family protein [Haematospirillum sp. H4485]NKD88043.1 CreA family protein [Haematospirillum sp. 15-248]
MKYLAAALACITLLKSTPSGAEDIGSVDTAFKLLGPNHKIAIEAFDDPDVPGVTCYISRSKTGGISGALGLAEDTSDASIACRQVGPITVPANLKAKDGDNVFSERRSILFKTMQVVRFYDQSRNVLLYLVYSDKLIEGSPKNALTAVPVMPWDIETVP